LQQRSHGGVRVVSRSRSLSSAFGCFGTQLGGIWFNKKMEMRRGQRRDGHRAAFHVCYVNAAWVHIAVLKNMSQRNKAAGWKRLGSTALAYLHVDKSNGVNFVRVGYIPGHESRRVVD